MFMRCHRCRQCVVSFRNGAGQLGMIGVHAGIDHRHQHLVALGEPVRLRQPQLGEFVLRGVAFGHGVALNLLQREQIIRLRRCDDPIGFQYAHHRGDRAAVGNPPAEQGGAGQLERLGFDAGEPIAALQRVDLLRTDGIGDFDHHFVGHQPPLIGRRRTAWTAPRRALRRPARALRHVVAIVDILPAGRHHLRDRQQHTGPTPAAAAIAAAIITAAAARRPAGADIRRWAAAKGSLREGSIGRRQDQRRDGRDAEYSVTMRAHGEVSGAVYSSHSVVAMKPTTLSSCSFLTMRASSAFGSPVTATRTL